MVVDGLLFGVEIQYEFVRLHDFVAEYEAATIEPQRLETPVFQFFAFVFD